MAVNGLRPGRSSMVGLEWLASVGASSLEAWSTAAGWAQSTGYSHALRLRQAGWVDRAPMAHGSGALFFATRTGVRVSDVCAPALGQPPSPVS